MIFTLHNDDRWAEQAESRRPTLTTEVDSETRRRASEARDNLREATRLLQIAEPRVRRLTERAERKC